jgi:hypothetical protein
LMGLLTTIEASHSQKELASSSKWLTKETEFKRLSCSINYNLKVGSSSRGRVKERAVFGSF